MAKNYNRVPQGRAGTGEAYILPESQSLNNLMNTIENNRRMGLLNVKAQDQHNQQLNKAFLDNSLKVKSGILYQDELNKASQAWMNKGTEYRVAGFNPFSPDTSDPLQVKASQEFLAEKAKVEDMAGLRDRYEKNFTDQQKEYQKGGYDEDSWSAFNDFYKTNKLSDLHQAGVMPPSLTKAFDWNDFNKGISKATIKGNEIVDNVETTFVRANEDAIRTSVQENINLNPQAQRAFKKMYGIDESQAPVKTLLGTTDPNQIASYVTDWFKSPEGVKEALKVFPEGTVPSFNSPEFQFAIQAATQKQLEQEERYQAGIQDLTELKMSEVNQSETQKLNFDYEKELRAKANDRRAQGRYGMSVQSNARAAESHKRKMSTPVGGAPKSTQADRDREERSLTVQGIRAGSPKYVDTLRGLARSKGGKVGYIEGGNKLVVRYTPSAKGSKPVERIIDLTRNSESDQAEINQVLNDLTGKTVGIENILEKDPNEFGVFQVGPETFTKDEIAAIRQRKPDPKKLAQSFVDQGYVSNLNEAYLLAKEMLDPKGKKYTYKK